MSSPKPLTLCVESFNDAAGYVAWIDNEKFKGIVVQAPTLKEVFEELFLSLKVKFAYELGISISGVTEKIDAMVESYAHREQDCPSSKQELNLTFA